MGASKSQDEDIYLDFVLSVVDQGPHGSTSLKNLAKDREVLTSRFINEGVSFLTKSLPRLGKALDLGLTTGFLCVPEGFKRAHRCTGIPAFLQDYFRKIFKEDGCLLEEPDVDCVKHLRQVLFMLYKLELPYSRESEVQVVSNFVSNDSGLRLDDGAECSILIDAANYIVRGIVAGLDCSAIIPRHGPGAVATGERQEDKWEFSRLYSGIHQVYPYYDYYITGWGEELADRLEWYRSLERVKTGTAKVCLVPKDSRGPRLISCEPLEYQWIQQGLGRKVMDHLEHHPMTRGRINFTSQQINRDIALTSSRTGEYATIDLKDASDLVSLELVRKIFHSSEHVLRALEATRTTATKLPDGSVITLKKFAPMGSALCFPIEALCFWAICVAAVANTLKMRPQEVGSRIFVYGDDIIIPVDWASTVIYALELCGLKVNRSKSCITGNFRESCGMDAFKGICVTPIRVKKPWIDSRSGVTYASYMASAQLMHDAGYDKFASLVWKRLESIYGFIPYGLSNSPFPCKVVSSHAKAISHNRGKVKHRWNVQLQRIEFRVRYIKSRKRDLQLDNWPRLLRALCMPQDGDPSKVDIPTSTLIKIGWSSI